MVADMSTTRASAEVLESRSESNRRGWRQVAAVCWWVVGMRFSPSLLRDVVKLCRSQNRCACVGHEAHIPGVV